MLLSKYPAMPPPRFQHGYAYDVFLSYTQTDDQPDAGRRWVTQFMNDLRTRLEIVSGHAVNIWRDEEKLRAADRFNDTIAHAVAGSAVLLVVGWVEGKRHTPEVQPICLLPVSSGSASIAEP